MEYGGGSVFALKQEIPDVQSYFPSSPSSSSKKINGSGSPPLIEVSSDPDCDDFDSRSNKKPKLDNGFCNVGDGDHGLIEIDQTHNGVVLPVGFLAPPTRDLSISSSTNFDGNTMNNTETVSSSLVVVRRCKQFWKAGDYEDDNVGALHPNSSGMDHVRVHPKFLHSNATSHKWALGAFAELLDNALDEVCNGATYVHVDVLTNEKDHNKMLLVQDNGGGMNPDKMRQCMSLGYSAKSRIANTIGQYGNGFKTSTMRLGADVIVFSCCQGKYGKCPTKSIGMLSYTFLQSTGKEDIVVPMVDYEKKGDVWTKMIRSSIDDWHMNLETIIHWSPYSSGEELLQQFNFIDDQGTRIIIYNLWEDDIGQLELDFNTDPTDIQIRGVNRDEKKRAMGRQYRNSKHFLTYQQSLRNYASILYLRLPIGFRIILRGKDVEHHNLANDMMHTKQTAYKPQPIGDVVAKDPENIQALVTIGFVKNAEDHIDIQGFNVYHKNRLIRPFWRVWNAAGSDGRGVIGVLEANFVEPAHDKQGFERTTALARLEARLIQLQKSYWRENCHKIGYAPRRSLKKDASQTAASSYSDIARALNGNPATKFDESTREIYLRKSAKQGSPSADHSSEEDMTSNHFESPLPRNQIATISSIIKTEKINGNLHEPVQLNTDVVVKLRKENLELKKRIQDAGGSSLANLLRDLHFERDRCKSLEAQLEEANKKITVLDKDQEALIQIFSEERDRRGIEEENLRTRLEAASTTIQQLLDKVKALEKMKNPSCKN